MKQVALDVPIALQNLIRANNTLLKTYQSQLLEEVQQANLQMMQILRIDPATGWRLDMDTMKYVLINEEAVQPEITDPNGHTVGDNALIVG